MTVCQLAGRPSGSLPILQWAQLSPPHLLACSRLDLSPRCCGVRGSLCRNRCSVLKCGRTCPPG